MEWPLKTGFTVPCFQTEPDFLYIVFSTFNEFVECIADELLTGDNREEMESCMGNLQTFFERHRQNLTRSFPELAEFKVFECLGKRILNARIQRGDRGSRPPLKNNKNIGFPSNTGPDLLKIPSQYSMLGCHRHTSGTPFKWHFPAGLIISPLSGIWNLPSLINYKKMSKLDPL